MNILQKSKEKNLLQDISIGFRQFFDLSIFFAKDNSYYVTISSRIILEAQLKQTELILTLALTSAFTTLCVGNEKEDVVEVNTELAVVAMVGLRLTRFG